MLSFDAIMFETPSLFGADVGMWTECDYLGGWTNIISL